ncbi:hypothetical protein [Mesorhizobium sp. IMUNJ 23232]|uniref:hypothetical protein n=1 Tax=Mesorhizobium sp. IMUNJ 23232 TaxID=3376064 RepID=UPI0037925B9C
MTLLNTPFLRNALLLDAVFSGAGALLMAGGASLLSSLLGLPQPLLFWAGVVLLPWTILVAVLSRRPAISRLLLIDVIGINALWAAASIGLLLTGLVSPTVLGYTFVVAQAAAVALFAELQLYQHAPRRECCGGLSADAAAGAHSPLRAGQSYMGTVRSEPASPARFGITPSPALRATSPPARGRGCAGRELGANRLSCVSSPRAGGEVARRAGEGVMPQRLAAGEARRIIVN